MLETPVKNSPRMLFSSLMIWGLMALMMFPMTFAATAEDAPPTWLYPALLVVLFVFIVVPNVIVWNRTVLYRTDDELVKEFSFISRTKKTVPYAKIASVNVVRTVFDRILGTATIQVNINSSMNSTVPEIQFIFDLDMANKVRDELSSRIYGNHHNAEHEHVYESIVPFTAVDSVMHGLFGASTGMVLMSAIGFSVPMLEALLTGGIGALGILLLTTAVMSVIPILQLIVKYYNFKVYKIGDTVYLEHGMIQQYRKSFSVNRINAVRVKRTLVARMLHKASLEVEVVGITAAGDDPVPTLCIMTSLDNIKKVMDEIVPDFEYMSDGMSQPKEAHRVWFMKAVYATLATGALLAMCEAYFITNDFAGFEAEVRIAEYLILALFLVLSGLYFFAVHVGFKVNRFEMGEDKFMFQSGIIDRSRVIMQYDRVQIAKVYAWPLAHRLGLGRCSIRMLSAVGEGGMKSGYFPREDLEKVQDEVMARIRDGRYDYRKMQF